MALCFRRRGAARHEGFEILHGQILANIEGSALTPEEKAILDNDITSILNDQAQKQNEVIQLLHKDLEEMRQLLADIPDSVGEIKALQSGVSQLNSENVHAIVFYVGIWIYQSHFSLAFHSLILPLQALYRFDKM